MSKNFVSIMPDVLRRARQEEDYSKRFSYDPNFPDQLTLDGRYNLTVDPEQVDRAPRTGRLDVIVDDNEDGAFEFAQRLSSVLSSESNSSSVKGSVLNSRIVKHKQDRTILELYFDSSVLQMKGQSNSSRRYIISNSVYMDVIVPVLKTIDDIRKQKKK